MCRGFCLWWVLFVYLTLLSLQDSVVKILDTLYHDRDYARFFVLETIARVPYFGECQCFFDFHFLLNSLQEESKATLAVSL